MIIIRFFLLILLIFILFVLNKKITDNNKKITDNNKKFLNQGTYTHPPNEAVTKTEINTMIDTKIETNNAKGKPSETETSGTKTDLPIPQGSFRAAGPSELGYEVDVTNSEIIFNKKIRYKDTVDFDTTVDFKEKVNFNYFANDLVPRGTIVAFTGKIIPLGWAPCTGKCYKLSASNKGKFEEVSSCNCTKFQLDCTDKGVPVIKTPDLIGRFILGVRNLDYKLHGIGGDRMNKIRPENMPIHNHNDPLAGVGYTSIDNKHIDGDYGGGRKTGRPIPPIIVASDDDGYEKGHLDWARKNSDGVRGRIWFNHVHKIHPSGLQDPVPMDILPPYYKLIYIMKI